MSCELGLKETTEPTGGTQNREYWGGPTNGRAAAPQRRGQPALRVSTAAQTGLNVVHHIETPPVPLLGGGGKKKEETPDVGVKTPSWQDRR